MLLVREIRAVFDDDLITIYQAYPVEIAEPALRAGRFVPPFKPNRMTWIKPSFLWMMYRSGWATKPGQERILAVSITRAGFEWALNHAVLSHYEPGTHPDRATWQRRLRAAPTRIQWDPERDLHLQPLPYRSLQLGLGPDAAAHYTTAWTASITDVTELAHTIHARTQSATPAAAAALLPPERPYPWPTP
ncbi:DUF4291 domain-containing protein [Actinoplanes sp. NPDC023936]|uniref:DUF4291 domain-containing protein n=1 Tax=Actinoplanes sp. NPDC023936 TaxID=3154910 RepID=UPI0033D4D480